MTIEIWLTFIVACLAFSSAPGVGILFTINHAISTNTQYTVLSILGIELALAIYVVIVGLGLNTILAESILLFLIIKWCGVAYLVWIGMQKLLSKKTLNELQISNELKTYKKAIKAGMFVNFSNPKSIIFLAAFFPQFITPNKNIIEQYLILGLTMIIIDTVFHSFYAVFASKLKKHILNKNRVLIINRIFGALFISAGVFIAKASRENI